MKYSTAIIVLYFNKIRLTQRCLQSILEAGYPPQQMYCFDNGSQVGINQQILNEFPRCNHQRIEDNLGFSGGFNRSLKWVFSKGISSALFCTNDTLVKSGAPEACLATASRTNAGMVAPLISFLNNNKKIDSIGAFFDPSTGTLHHYREEGLPLIMNSKNEYMPGTALWIHRDAFIELGGTDESFHMFWEDVDLCFRAHQRGIPLARCYEANLLHGGGQTTRKKPLYTTFYFQRNRIRFCKRFMEGENLKLILQKIQQELNILETQWKENEDRRRLEYLKKLKEEIKAPSL